MRMGNQGRQLPVPIMAGGILGGISTGAAGGGAVCGEADILDPVAAPHRGSQTALIPTS